MYLKLEPNDVANSRSVLRCAPLEKIPLETYVPPAKPSLIGLSRAEIADRLGEIGVAPAQRKMRTQQLWHWMYVRGAKAFDEMTSISKEMRAQLEQHFTVDRPEVVAEQVSNDGTRKWLLRLPSGDAFQKAHEVECVYIPETDRGTLVRLLAGRLHAELLVLPHRHAAAGAQSHRRRDRRPDHGGARPPQRLGRSRDADRQPPRHQRRHDGHGRAAL